MESERSEWREMEKEEEERGRWYPDHSGCWPGSICGHKPVVHIFPQAGRYFDSMDRWGCCSGQPTLGQSLCESLGGSLCVTVTAASSWNKAAGLEAQQAWKLAVMRHSKPTTPLQQKAARQPGRQTAAVSYIVVLPLLHLRVIMIGALLCHSQFHKDCTPSFCVDSGRRILTW